MVLAQFLLSHSSISHTVDVLSLVTIKLSSFILPTRSISTTVATWKIVDDKTDDVRTWNPFDHGIYGRDHCFLITEKSHDQYVVFKIRKFNTNIHMKVPTSPIIAALLARSGSAMFLTDAATLAA